MTLDKTRYKELVKHLSQAVELVGQGVKLAETSRLRTAREWLRRSRALIRQGMDILELEIMDNEDQQEQGGG
jgi:hypothetical protein